MAKAVASMLHASSDELPPCIAERDKPVWHPQRIRAWAVQQSRRACVPERTAAKGRTVGCSLSQGICSHRYVLA
jgi:hypothetical protein